MFQDEVFESVNISSNWKRVKLVCGWVEFN